MFCQSQLRLKHRSHSELLALLAEEVTLLEMLLELMRIFEVNFSITSRGIVFIFFAEEALVVIIDHVTLELVLIIEPSIATKSADRVASGSEMRITGLKMRIQLLRCVDIHLGGENLPFSVTNFTEEEIVRLEMRLQRQHRSCGVKNLPSVRKDEDKERHGGAEDSTTFPQVGHRKHINLSKVSLR